jgi:tRNA-specific adenosine deaminase 2
MDGSLDQTSADLLFMEMALAQARDALGRGEVPVGCVLVNNSDVVVARGSNRTTERGNATAHAELMAFEELMQPVEAASLTLYVTCEPCIMCASAIVQVGCVRRVVFGCSNPRFGGCGTVRSLDIYSGQGSRDPDAGEPKSTPDLTIVQGIRACDAVQLLTDFYLMTNPNAPPPKRKRRRHNDH